MAKIYDYIIVGGGISGCIIAYKLHKKGLNIAWFDDASSNVSSSNSGGIFNPISGKYFNLAWQVGECFDQLHAFYKKVEQETIAFLPEQKSFFYPKPIYRIFPDKSFRNDWEAKQQDSAFAPYLHQPAIVSLDSNLYKNPYGALAVKQGGNLDVPLFIKAIKTYLSKKVDCFDVLANINELKVDIDIIELEGIKAHQIIFCEGPSVVNNPYFNDLPFIPNKGEWLEIEQEDNGDENIVISSCFKVNYNSKISRIGSTYAHEFETREPTKTAKENIEKRLKKFYKKSFSTITHKAGIRPTIRDRKPVMGTHKEHLNMHIFNGMGSKGVSMTPLATQYLIDYLEKGKIIPREINIQRFYKKQGL